MQSVEQPIIENEVISAGVDWITATAKHGNVRWCMEEFARRELERARDAGADVRLSARMGYSGYSTKHFFYGRREGGSIIVASSEVADNVWRSVAEVSDNVARLDLQVTISTPTERPHLARHAYSVLKSSPPASIRVRNCTLITSHPKGETCNVGKRKSDQNGRIYDKATEAGIGDPRSLWRYEVEFKRGLASAVTDSLRTVGSSEAPTRALVHRWYRDRGLTPCFNPDASFCTQKRSLLAPDRDTLTWFQDSVSISVARAIKRHGLAAVLKSLGLDAAVTVRE